MLEEHKFRSAKHPGDYLDYLSYAPTTPTDKLPLMIYIHDAGNRGSSLKPLRNDHILQDIARHRCTEAMLIAPQCHSETWFDLFHVLKELISNARQDSRVDSRRVYLLGAGMGAYAVWQLCISHPTWFAAAVPVCGGGMYWNAGRLKNLPVWAFHGLKDNTVLPCESSHMVDAINRLGGHAKLTCFPNADHNAWDPAFSHEPMWVWLFQQKIQEENYAF